jgi:hypothetical protein
MCNFLGITGLIHDHFAAATTITLRLRLGLIHDHFAAHPSSKNPLALPVAAGWFLWINRRRIEEPRKPAHSRPCLSDRPQASGSGGQQPRCELSGVPEQPSKPARFGCQQGHAHRLCPLPPCCRMRAACIFLMLQLPWLSIRLHDVLSVAKGDHSFRGGHHVLQGSDLDPGRPVDRYAC